jgi:hypothetical protein
MTKRDAFNELLNTGVGYARAVRIRVLADLEKHEFVVREDYLPEIWRANGSSRSARDYNKKLNVVTKIFKQLNREGILREEIYAKSHDGPRTYVACRFHDRIGDSSDDSQNNEKKQ